MRHETADSSDRTPCLGRTLTTPTRGRLDPNRGRGATLAARPDVSRAPRGVRLLPATALQAPHREAPHEPQPVRTRGRRCPQNPARPETVSAHRGVLLLSAPALQVPHRGPPREPPHEPQTVRTRGCRCRVTISSLVPTCLARLAACISYRLPLFNRRVAKRLTNCQTVTDSRMSLSADSLARPDVSRASRRASLIGSRSSSTARAPHREAPHDLRLLATHATRPGYCKNHQKK